MEWSWIQASESTKLVRQGCCFLHYSLASLTTNEFECSLVCCFMHMLRYTCEKTGLSQWPNVSSAFKQIVTKHDSIFRRSLLNLLIKLILTFFPKRSNIRVIFWRKTSFSLNLWRRRRKKRNLQLTSFRNSAFFLIQILTRPRTLSINLL